MAEAQPEPARRGAVSPPGRRARAPATSQAQAQAPPTRPLSAGPAASHTGISDLHRLQRQAGNRAVRSLLTAPAVQRQTAAMAPPGTSANREEVVDDADRHLTPVDNFQLGGLAIQTYAEAAVALRAWSQILVREGDELAEKGLSIPAEVQERRAEALVFAELLEGGASQALDRGNADDMRAWHTDFIRARNAVRIAESNAVARKADRTANELRRTLLELRKLEPQLRAAQRAQFRAEDTAKLVDVVKAIDKVAGAVLTVDSVIRDTRELSSGLRAWANTGRSAVVVVDARVHIPTIRASLQGLVRVIQAVELSTAAVDLVYPSGVTEVAAAGESIQAFQTLAGATTGFFPLGSVFTAYYSGYLGAATERCLQLVAHIADLQSRTHNRNAIALNMLDSVNWTVEPGGRPMHDYMVAVMEARSPAQVPGAPPPVAEYFEEHSSLFDAGVRSAQGLPTTGMLWWRATDTDRLGAWAYDNRDDLWGMLYGTRRVGPAPGR